MRSRIVLLPIVIAIAVSCGAQEKNSDLTNDTSDMASESNSDTQEPAAPLSSIDKPLKPGELFDTKGWSDMRVELLGVASERMAMIYAGWDDYDPALDYVVAKFSGINKHGEKTNMYKTMHACVPGGAVGKSGIFRELEFSYDEGEYQLITTSDDEVLDGFPNSGIALYLIERGDTSAFIMSQSTSCGHKHDLVVAIGDVSSLPIIP